MIEKNDITQQISSLFPVYEDEANVLRIITPFTYYQTNERVVIRVRPSDNGFVIDENGDAAFYASMNQGDIECEAVSNFVRTLVPVKCTKEYVIFASTNDIKLIANYIFHVADTAMKLFLIATSRLDYDD